MARTRETVSMVKTADKEQSNVWDFPVYQEELITSRGQKSGIHAVVRGDTHAVIGEYRGEKVLPYTDIVGGLDAAFAGMGQTFKRNIVTTRNGARMFARYDMGNGMHVAGDAYNRVVMAKASHDGSIKLELEIGALRLACFNGSFGFGTLVALAKKHQTEFDLPSVIAGLVEGLQRGQLEMESVLNKMTQVSVDDRAAQNTLSNLVKMGTVAGVSTRAALLINHNWNNPSEDEKPLGNTLYRLYNAATRYTRDVENVGRFELANRANAYITGAFGLAIRQNNLNALFGTPEKPIDFASVVVNN